MSDSAYKTQSQEPQSDPKPSSPDPPAAAGPVQVETGGEAEEEEEEEKGECGFCLFMKGGGCKESFEAWENCIEEAEKTNEDIVRKCFEMTSKLKDCMLAHPDYYEPILRAEEQAIKELDSDKSKDKEEEAVRELNNDVNTPAAEKGKGSTSRLH